MDYFAVFCHEYGYINNLFWRLEIVLCSFFYKYFFKRISSFWTDILTWTLMRICINVNVFLINILINILLSSTVNMVYFWRLVLRSRCFVLKYCNWLSSILDLKHFNMNWNDNLHQCESFLMDFFDCCLLMSMVAKIICFWRMGVGHWYYTVVF